MKFLVFVLDFISALNGSEIPPKRKISPLTFSHLKTMFFAKGDK